MFIIWIYYEYISMYITYCLVLYTKYDGHAGHWPQTYCCIRFQQIYVAGHFGGHIKIL